MSILDFVLVKKRTIAFLLFGFLSFFAQANSSVESDSLKLSFSHESGFYEQSFQLKISSYDAKYQIAYTLDGSNPQFSPTSITVSETINVSINPLSTENRALTPAVIVRVCLKQQGIPVTKPLARTFVFIEQVKKQMAPGGSWPTDKPNDQLIDLEMDAEVVEDVKYADLIDDALLEIPSISIVTDNENLFSADSGIYVNALQDGRLWERECSIELLNHKGTDGFNVNAGIRIRGGYSRHEFFARHSFRFFFRTEYGDSKLNYPLFEDEGVSEFDKIDLRCPQSMGWSRDWNDEGRLFNTFIRDIFARDAQAASGKPYTRSRYYHLYLNGMYWGIYQTQERCNGQFAESYFGGDRDDYDVIKTMGVEGKYITIAEGTEDKWLNVYERTLEGFASNADYFALEGKNEWGEPIRNSEVLVDIDNLIDYILNIFYTGNYDSSPSKWAGNKQPNNMYVLTNREDKSQGFKFFIHDAEYSLMVDAFGPGIGLYEDRVNIGTLEGNRKMRANDFYTFSIQWLHFKLSDNAEYRMRFADRAQELFTDNGVYTPENNLKRFEQRVAQIDTAIIAESARWGDGADDSYKTLTKDNAWSPELNSIREAYFPYRTDIVIEQMKEANLYPNFESPTLTDANNNLLEGIVPLMKSLEVSIRNPNSEGAIYYTNDNRDPRLLNGDVSENARVVEHGSNWKISHTQILKFRVFDGEEWSGLKEVAFMLEQTDFSNLKITELHYHPLNEIVGDDTISEKSFEFIEFKNIGLEQAINLSGLKIDSAIYYEFPEGTVLAPQAYYVVASKPAKFYNRYGSIASGNYSKSLSNKGEQILVLDANNKVVLDFYYTDEKPWPTQADGDGVSLCSSEINPEGNPNDYAYWENSKQEHGTPFYHDESHTTQVEGLGYVESDFSVFPNPTKDKVTISSRYALGEDAIAELYDVNGVKLFSHHFVSQTTISLANKYLKHGIYMLHVKTESSISNKKIIYLE